MEDAVRKQRLDLLEEASEWLKKQAAFQSKRKKFQAQLESFPSLIQERTQQLAIPLPNRVRMIEGSDSVEALQRQLQVTRNELGAKKADLKENEKDSRHYSERITSVPEERAAAIERLRTADQTIEQLETEADDTDHQISLLNQYAIKRASQAELQMLDIELQRQELAGRLLPLERDLLARDVQHLESQIPQWEEALADFRRREVERRVSAAREAAMNVHPKLREIAKRNEELTQEESKIHEKLESLHRELTELQSAHSEMSDRYHSLRQKIEETGLNSANGMQLVELRRDLLPAGESLMRIRQIESEIQWAKLKVNQLKDERDQLSNPQNTAAELIGSDDSSKKLFHMALEFVQDKRNYLDQLKRDYQAYQRLLGTVAVSRSELVDLLADARGYIDKNALWIRSTNPIGLSDLGQIREGAQSFFDVAKWSDLGLGIRDRIWRRPYESAAAIFGMGVLFVFSRRLRSNLN